MNGAAGGRDRYVIMVVPSLTMGGTEAQLATMLEASEAYLRRVRLTVLTIMPDRDPSLQRRFAALGVRVDTIDRTRMGFAAFLVALVRYFRRERPAIVHAFLAGSTGTWGRIAARLAGVPHALLSDRSLEPSMTRVQRLLDPVVRRLTTRFLPNAAATEERLRRQGVPPDRIRLVRNGVDLERFDPDTVRSRRDAWGIPADAVVAGFLGMFRREKRPELLLDALAALPPAARPDHVVFAGDGALRPELERRIAADPWMQERCHLLGVVGDTPAFLAGIDFLVLTSDAEGMPNAIMEAMAMAKPCVATRVSDVAYLVETDAYLAERGDAAGLADAIRRMTALPGAERAALGARARARAVREFGMAAAAERFWGAHEDLLPAAPEARRG